MPNKKNVDEDYDDFVKEELGEETAKHLDVNEDYDEYVKEQLGEN
ncbi:MAG: hypothetical protein PHY47_00695 [Lachnospiraceae bacterium]|nr:hypothetical protein [Lachnospiraceae bacterium]